MNWQIGSAAQKLYRELFRIVLGESWESAFAIIRRAALITIGAVLVFGIALAILYISGYPD